MDIIYISLNCFPLRFTYLVFNLKINKIQNRHQKIFEKQ